MGKSILLLFLSLFFFSIISSMDSANSSCPIDFSYVETYHWNKSLCLDPEGKHCCLTLLSLIGMGLALYLRETSMFQLPSETAGSSCLSEFQGKLAAASINPSFVTFCFPNSTDFVTNKSSCAGIVTTEDWKEKVGPTSLLDSNCNNLTEYTDCSSCVDAGYRVNSQLKSSKNQRVIRLAIGLLGAFVVILLASGLIILYREWDKKRKREALHEELVNSIQRSVLPNSGAKWFHISELEQATYGFSQENLIAQGASGVVYKGTLADGTLVAVKQIIDLDSKGDQEFTNEVEIISKIRHRTLLSLRGCCVTSDNLEGKRRYLVYDFMSNGTLSDRLWKTLPREKLTWPQRKEIILDVAKGLAYLHYGIRPSIYHRDIKATNILLDSEMKAKVADFGLAKQSCEGDSHLTTRIAGTYGYLAPEYGMYGQLTEKSDVYSFGIVILEIMSGRKALHTTNSEFLLITDWAWMHAKSGNVQEIFEESIREKGPKGIMERFALVGILCAHVMVAFLPTIAEALKMLEGDIDIPTLPDRPSPLRHESFQSSSTWHSFMASETSIIGSSVISSTMSIV